MKVLKGVAVSILSLVLFFSLGVFGLAYMVKSTVLEPAFMSAELDKIDMPAVARQAADKWLIPQLPQQAQFLKEPIYGSLNDYSPSLKQQLKAASNSAYDYFLDKTPRLSMTFNLDPLKTSLRDRARQAFAQNLPPQVAALPAAQQEQAFNTLYQQYAAIIPSTLTVDENTIGQNMDEIRQAKQYIAWFNLGYKLLIPFMALLVLLIILIVLEVKAVTRMLGTNFLLYGGLEYAGLIIGKQFLPSSMPLADIPPALQTWLSQFMADILVPLQTFSLVLAIVGLVLLVASFIYRPSKAQPASENLTT